ncbi:SANT/Myb domain [Dillenia turbinata]|uniref:SANT/Myb domain n=1 Tax=Dillenia turbinata TaxID=194707 RepID=A0AAN8Z453_9MAGN
MGLSSFYIPKTISLFLKDLSMVHDNFERSSKLDGFVNALEDELHKIDAFKRELPLCMFLLQDAILKVKEQAKQWKISDDQPVIEKFVPLKVNSDEDEEDKKKWMSSARLWSTKEHNSTSQTDEQDEGTAPSKQSRHARNSSTMGGAFMPFNRECGLEVKEQKRVQLQPLGGLSLVPCVTSELKTSNLGSKGGGNFQSVCGSSYLFSENVKVLNKPYQQTCRKQRRCWSPELHRRFINALQQLGGCQAATPKQIRELMQVDGLTNDEVKSHLQKYRLHVKRVSAPNSDDSWMVRCVDSASYNTSPEGPFHSVKGNPIIHGDSMEEVEDEDDENSECLSWKSQQNNFGENYVQSS